MSIGHKLDSRSTGGFDYLRLILAVAVLVWHNFSLSSGQAAYDSFGSTIGGLSVRIILPLFFALSGFLVAMSLERIDDIGVFLWHRFIRIYPALTVEVILSALLIGTLFTSVSLYSYFTDRLFIIYFWNIIGYIHYALPGVFLSNPYPGIVNGSLWTVPYELECYAILAALHVSGVFRRKWLFYLTFALLSAAAGVHYRALSYDIMIAVPGRMLVMYFLAGAVVYHLRYRLPSGASYGLAALLASAALLYFPGAIAFSPLPAAYAVAALGCTNPKRTAVVSSGDYSYGIYLYAFPIQQAVVAVLGGANLVLNLVVSAAAVSVFAVFSWHAIEKPTLRWKGAWPGIAGAVRGRFRRTSGP